MAYELFNAKAPWIMELLMRDFAISVQDAAAILGNLGHECGGFRLMQEQKPTVKGSKGGYGWAQWTGPRRRAFEAYCQRNNLSPDSDKANYGWLFAELKFHEKRAIPSIKGDNDSLDKDVQDFELAFERAGVKHYKSRGIWARRALDAYNAAPKPITLPGWALPGAVATEPPKHPIPRPDDEPDPIAINPRQPDDPGVDPDAKPAGKKTLSALIIAAIVAVFSGLVALFSKGM